MSDPLSLEMHELNGTKRDHFRSVSVSGLLQRGDDDHPAAPALRHLSASRQREFRCLPARNNRAALVPAILPAMLLLAASIILLADRPTFMSGVEAFAAFTLNLIALASSFVWQRRLQSEMAERGYDQRKVRLLISTNWLRTGAFLIQAALATTIALRAIQMTR